MEGEVVVVAVLVGLGWSVEGGGGVSLEGGGESERRVRRGRRGEGLGTVVDNEEVGVRVEGGGDGGGMEERARRGKMGEIGLGSREGPMICSERNQNERREEVKSVLFFSPKTPPHNDIGYSP